MDCSDSVSLLDGWEQLNANQSTSARLELVDGYINYLFPPSLPSCMLVHFQSDIK